MRVSGALNNVEELQQLPLLVNGKTIQLGDVAEVYRGFTDPAQPRMRFMGENGIGIAVSMRKGGDIIALGKIWNRNLPGCRKLCLWEWICKSLRSAGSSETQY